MRVAHKTAGRTIVASALRFSVVAFIALAGKQSLAASAPDYPTKPVTFFALSGPGSGFDTTTRAVANALIKEKLVKVPLPIENSPNSAQAMTLVLHELTTNAAKYGALSTGQGHVDVSITRDDAGGVVVAWTERGGPKVAPPTHVGYGTQVIRDSIAHELDAKVDLAFPTTGVVCTITLPQKALAARPAPKAEQI